MKILIIEDTKEVSDLLEMMIKRLGHQPKSVFTGNEALEVIAKEMFELVLLDIFLPDMVAYELIPHIKAAWSGTEIITMTGFSTREIEEKVRSQGILYYMVKPVNYSELKSIIEHLSHNKDKSRSYTDNVWQEDIEGYY